MHLHVVEPFLAHLLVWHTLPCLACSTVNLHRQVGNRYFVSASNAARIYFLADAAVAFLKYTGKDCGNKLDMEVYAKLTNVQEMAQLRADALLYYHVYADLVMLSKSKSWPNL